MSVLTDNPEMVIAALAVCVERLGDYVKVTKEENRKDAAVMSRFNVDGLLELKTIEEGSGNA